MSAAPYQPVLSERALQIFKSLVERYIADGQPVGSRTLSRDVGLDLSPATIRNVMADLEDLGLVRSPHTSAGRVPTVKGYRLFVDSLLTVRALAEKEIRRISTEMGQVQDLRGLLQRTSFILSTVTSMASVVMLPKLERKSLRMVEFLPLSDNRVLVIMVINRQEVENRIIHTDRPYSTSELEQAANFLNASFGGIELPAIRDALLEKMRSAREEMNRMMQAVVEVAEKAFAEQEQGADYVVAGQTHLMGFTELADMDKLRQLFEAFNYQREMLRLLDQALNAPGVQIFIGEESGYRVLDECSVVTSRYESSEGRVLGVLGVIGPTRMAYERVIPIVDLTAKLLGSALNSSH